MTDEKRPTVTKPRAPKGTLSKREVLAELEWEVVRDRMSAFQSEIRLRNGEWTLHSWNPFTEIRGGGRVQPYPEQMVCSVWFRMAPGGRGRG